MGNVRPLALSRGAAEKEQQWNAPVVLWCRLWEVTGLYSSDANGDTMLTGTRCGQRIVSHSFTGSVSTKWAFVLALSLSFSLSLSLSFSVSFTLSLCLSMTGSTGVKGKHCHLLAHNPADAGGHRSRVNRDYSVLQT